MDLIQIMLQDDGVTEYFCDPFQCDYNGESYCQNCGFAKDES